VQQLNICAQEAQRSSKQCNAVFLFVFPGLFGQPSATAVACSSSTAAVAAVAAAAAAAAALTVLQLQEK
jgi:hypothetical protein